MDAPRAPDVPGYDASAAAAVISATLAQRGGAALVVESLGRLAGAQLTPARSGLFRSSPASVLLGTWRYEVRADQLAAAHVVGGIALAQSVLPALAAGKHVASALAIFVAEQGNQLLPDVLAMLEGLAVASS